MIIIAADNIACDLSLQCVLVHSWSKHSTAVSDVFGNPRILHI